MDIRLRDSLFEKQFNYLAEDIYQGRMQNRNITLSLFMKMLPMAGFFKKETKIRQIKTNGFNRRINFKKNFPLSI